MKKNITILFVLLSFICEANTYYFSVIGNDGNSSAQAQSKSTPWKTLAKMNSYFANLNAGDSILLNRGETFTGQIKVTRQGIVISAYGTGANPLVSGFTTLAGWTNMNAHLWYATLIQSKLNVVTFNGQMAHIGRYPNNNYLYYQSFDSTLQVTDTASIAHDWTGGEIVIRTRNSVINRGLITSQASGNINYSSYAEIDYPSVAGFGYFIQNHLSNLDQEREWCFNTNTLTIYQNVGETPATQVIKASSIDTLLSIYNFGNTVVSNVNFEGANTTAVYTTGTGTSILNCRISFCLNAISGNAGNILIKNDSILNILNDGIRLSDASNYCVVSNNYTKNIGFVPGMGTSGEDSYQAIILRGNNNLISFNVVDSTGYSGIRFDGGFTTVRGNTVTNFLFVKDDGGGIYTWNGNVNPPILTNQKIVSNTVTNAIGAGAGTPAGANACGVYLDEGSANIDIDSNIVTNCLHSGMLIQDTKNINIRYNTISNCGGQLFLVDIKTGYGFAVRNVNISYNTIGTQRNQSLLGLLSVGNDVDSFATYDHNTYFTKFVFQSQGVNVSSDPFFSANTFLQWQALGNDVHSTYNVYKLGKPLNYYQGGKPLRFSSGGKNLKMSNN